MLWPTSQIGWVGLSIIRGGALDPFSKRDALLVGWRPQRDLNPRYRRERAMS